MKNRILASLLIVCMLLVMLPVTAVTVLAAEIDFDYSALHKSKGYTFTINGVRISENGYYTLDGTKVDDSTSAAVQVTNVTDKKISLINGTTYQQFEDVFEWEHSDWEKEAVGVYIAGKKATESGYYNNDGSKASESGPVYVDLSSKKITLNGATIAMNTGELPYDSSVADSAYPSNTSWVKGAYNGIQGVEGVLVITEGIYKTQGTSQGRYNWDSKCYWAEGYTGNYLFGSIGIGIMVDDESGEAYEGWTLELVGENAITVYNEFAMPQQLPSSGTQHLLNADAYGVFAEANLTITGSGSLKTDVSNQWDVTQAGYLDYWQTCNASGVWTLGDLNIVGGTVEATTSTKTYEIPDYGITMTNTNYAGAIGAAGDVTISGENTVVNATDTTSQGVAIRGGTSVTITDKATVEAASTSTIAGVAIAASVASKYFSEEAPVTISGGAKVTATAESTASSDLIPGTGSGIVGSIVDISDSTIEVDAEMVGIGADVLNVGNGDVDVEVSNEDGQAVSAAAGSIVSGSYNTPVDSDLIADGSVVADGAVMPKEELGDYTARIENTYYTGEDGGNKAIADLVNKQTVWLNTDTTASNNSFELGNTVTIMLAEGKTFTGTLAGPGVKAEVTEGHQEELDKVLYTEYIYTMVVDSEQAEAKVVHADGTETYYKDFFYPGVVSDINSNKLAADDVVVLLRDVESDSDVRLYRSMNLDLNGHTITFSDFNGFNIYGNNEANAVTVVITDSSEGETGEIENTSNHSSIKGTAISISNYATVTILGGTFTGDIAVKTSGDTSYATLDGGTFSNVTSSNGTIIVTDKATITGDAVADGGILILPNQNIGGDVSASDSDDVKWKIVDAEGNDADIADVEAGNCKLVIYGTGAMKSFRREDAPWIGYDGIISEIIIEDGVTNISDSAFDEMNGYDLTLGNSITSIDTFAMDYTVTSLGVVTIPAGMTANMNSIFNGYSSVYRTVKGFVVAEGNTVYSTDGDALYYSGDAEGKKLMKAAASIDGSYVIDDGTVDIKSDAFNNVVFESVTIPSSFNNVYTFRKLTAVPEGLVFGGYYTSKDPTVVEELRIDTTGDENKEAFTVYMVLGYEITYDFGNSKETVVVPVNQTIGDFAPAVTVDGKTLMGWSTAANGTEDNASSVAPTAAVTVYAVWATDESFTPEYKNITLEEIPAYTYTGEEIEPAVYYKDAAGNLKQVAENCVVYENNTNAGTATVNVVVGEEIVASTTFTINKAKFNAGNYSWQGATNVTYDGQIHSLTIKEELPKGVTVTYTYDGESVEGVKDVNYFTPGDPSSGVRSYPVKATFTLDENLEFAGNSNSYKTKTTYLYIYPLEATVTVNSATMYVGEDLPEFTYTVSGLEEGMNLTTEPTIATSASGNKAGNFPITASGAVVNNDANNYKITYVSGYLAVGMKILDAGVSFANSTVTYDGEEHNIAITVDGTLPESFSVAYTVNGEPFTGATNAGTYEVTATITSTDPAYEAIEPLTATLEIKPATVTITADDISIYVRGTIPTLTYTVDGLLDGDELTAEPTLTCDADVNSVGTYDIVPSGGEAGSNYVLAYVNGTLTVKRKAHIPTDIFRPSGTIDKNVSVSKKESVEKTDIVLTLDVALEQLGNQNVAFGTGTFFDVSKSDWFYSDVTALVSKGVINGYPDGSFRPQGVVTWGEALKLVMKAVGYGDIDAVNGHWASGFMAMAIEKGLIPGEVELDAAITRGEIAELTKAAMKLGEALSASPFADAAPEAAVALYEAGIINGSLDNGQLLYRAESTITRAEMAAIIWRVYCAR